MTADRASHSQSLHQRPDSLSATGPSLSSRPAASTSTSHFPSSSTSAARPASPLPPRSSASKSTRRASLAFSFPPLFFQPNTSSTSLVPSIAEGRPIPLDDDTAAHRTSALRELNSTYPSPVSRHRYAKSSGAASSTHSQPVIVRTYSGPSAAAPAAPPSVQGFSRRPASSVRRGSRRIPLTAAGTASSSTSFSPAVAKPTVGSTNHGDFLSMARASAQRKMPWRWGSAGGPHQHDPAKLPPLEAFSYKSLMAGLEVQGGTPGDIGADLDRIAEICARSRYSLSNQYEVHVAPHGSGAAFVATSSSSARRRGKRDTQGNLTLQAIQSDDDESAASRARRKRRGGGGRRRSAAYGTLETIMSSSRSSEEDKTKKKSAQEIAEEVRSRAARKQSPTGSASGSFASGAGDPAADDAGHEVRQEQQEQGAERHVRRKSMSFATAVMDSKNMNSDPRSTRNSATALVSEPALPQTSNSHLEIRTAPDQLIGGMYSQDVEPPSPLSRVGSEPTLTNTLTNADDEKEPTFLSGLSKWIPWGLNGPESPAAGQPGGSHAEGSLRDILKTVGGKPNKGKAVDSGE